MSQELFDANVSRACNQIPCNDTCKTVVDLFLELFQLLEDYAPVWYGEELRGRALAAGSVLNKARPFSSGDRVS